MTNPQPLTITDHIDPFTQVQDAIHALLAGHEGVRRAVKAGNRGGVQDRERKPLALDADFPELTVLPFGMLDNLHASSTTAMVTQTYQVSVQTGSMEEKKALNVVKWQILRAFGSVEAEAALNKPFIVDINLESGDEQPEKNARGTDQWTAILNVIVRMKFSRKNDLQAATPALNGA